MEAEALDAALRERLRVAGLKATAPRVAILRALFGDESHPTAQQLYERLLPELGSLSFATVYNTLHSLDERGALGRLELGGATRFDPNTEPHHHAVCDRCGAITDVPRGRMPRTPSLPGFRVERVEYVYRGICASCQEGEGAATEQA